MSHFKHHVFFCTNQRAEGDACCNNHGAGDMRAYAKDKVKALGAGVPGKVRINAAGCLDRCEQGPVMVIYPEAVWYTYVDQEDIDEIIDQHLVHGQRRRAPEDLKPLMSRHERILVDGPDGKIEVFVEDHENPQGIALIAHPHPLFGGTADNKVVTTLARAFRERGCITLRPSFRGVGGSEGEHDHGDAETDDVLAVHDWARARYANVLTEAGGLLPLYLAGFSFGAYVTTRLAKRLAAAGDTPEMAGAGRHRGRGFVEGMRRYETEEVPADTLVIHGADDETVRLANVLAWAQPMDLPVVVVPGADHFFHRRLHLLRDIIQRAWAGAHP